MSGNLMICAIPEELKEKLKTFRFSKSPDMNAIIVKIDREAQEMKIEEVLENCSLEEICDELPQQQPRFILLSYCYKRSDGRISYPMCLVFYSPPGCNPEQQMLYAGSSKSLAKECDLTKNFEIRDLEELTQEFLDSKVV